MIEAELAAIQSEIDDCVSTCMGFRRRIDVPHDRGTGSVTIRWRETERTTSDDAEVAVGRCRLTSPAELAWFHGRLAWLWADLICGWRRAIAVVAEGTRARSIRCQCARLEC